MKKTKVLKSWWKHNVPEDIWPDILSRLPVKSLLRFRCVSRSWQALIDDPEFARLHLTLFRNNRLQSHLFVVQTGSFRSRECVVRCSENLRTTSRHGFLQTDRDSVDDTFSLRNTIARGNYHLWHVVCSIDGLFLLKAFGQRLVLWNPSIRKSRILPPSPEISEELIEVDFGLGFDPLIRDYKFVRYVLSSTSEVRFVSIYTLGSNSWKSIEFQGEFGSGWGGRRSICFNGVLYALAKKGHSSTPFQLISFDLDKEMFASTGLLVVDDPLLRSSSHTLTKIDDGCSLAIVNLSTYGGSIWASKSLGADVKSWSWTQLYTFTMRIPECGDPIDWRVLSLKRNCEMLLRSFMNGTMVKSYSLETHNEKIVLKKDIVDGWPYMESLILLQVG